MQWNIFIVGKQNVRKKTHRLFTVLRRLHRRPDIRETGMGWWECAQLLFLFVYDLDPSFPLWAPHPGQQFIFDPQAVREKILWRVRLGIDWFDLPVYFFNEPL